MQALLLIPLVAVPFFVLFVLPQRRQLRAINAMQARIVEGDEIVTTSGIFGTIVSLDAETAELQIAPATTITIARRAIGRLVADLPSPRTSRTAPPTRPGDDPSGGEPPA